MTDTSMSPSGVNHVVLNVCDIEAAHAFWTETVGFKHVGDLKRSAALPNVPKMRFYSADGGGPMRHHDIALVENPSLPPPPKEWAIFGTPVALNHVAISFPSRAAWLARLEYLQAKGVKFNLRINHGVTHSLYINDPNGYGVELLYELPREVWEGDFDAALNYVEVLPTEGKAALVDEAVKIPVFGA